MTGGAGFIGQHLCRRLLEEGNHVICIDDLSTGLPRTVYTLEKEFKDRFMFFEESVDSNDISR